MNIQPIKILLSEDAQDLPLPCYQTAGAAGADIHAAIHTDIILMPQDITLIPTGLHLVLPDNIEAQIRPDLVLPSHLVSPSSMRLVQSIQITEVKLK